jgi:hypothetical protein
MSPNNGAGATALTLLAPCSLIIALHLRWNHNSRGYSATLELQPTGFHSIGIIAVIAVCCCE